MDLTGGLGVDTYYLSEGFDEIHYVERQQDLCALAEHNFALTGKPIHVHCCSAEEYLEKLDSADRTNKPHSDHGANKPEETTIFMDPARRDSHGGKVFRLEDCEPNAVALLSILRAHARRILLKLSPMLDLTEAVRALGGAAEIHVVAVRNEVKEVLVLLETGCDNPDPEITCVNLETDDETFSFRRSEEEATNRANWANEANSANEELTLIEPNAAIIKAGAFRTFAERYGLQKLDTNSHLYVLPKDSRSTQESSELLSKTWPCSMPTVPSSMRDRSETVRKRAALFDRIPGRIFTVRIATKNELKNLKQANVICRNYPMTPDALKKKLHLKDGGQTYLIGTKIAGKTTLFLGTRQFLHT